VIIWSRWGILVVVPLLLGLVTGSFLNFVLNSGVDDGPVSSMFVGVGLVMAGVYTYLLNHYLITPHLDGPRHVRPQPATPPAEHPQGARQAGQQGPVLHSQTGQPLFVRPRSSLFFVPVTAWPYVFAAIGIVVTISFTLVLLVG
jgi:hypothetical protein